MQANNNRTSNADQVRFYISLSLGVYLVCFVGNSLSQSQPSPPSYNRNDSTQLKNTLKYSETPTNKTTPLQRSNPFQRSKESIISVINRNQAQSSKSAIRTKRETQDIAATINSKDRKHLPQQMPFLSEIIINSLKAAQRLLTDDESKFNQYPLSAPPVAINLFSTKLGKSASISADSALNNENGLFSATNMIFKLRDGTELCTEFRQPNPMQAFDSGIWLIGC